MATAAVLAFAGLAAAGPATAAPQRSLTFLSPALEIRFPDGFGIPVWSDELLWLTTQVLNLDPSAPPADVRHRVTVDFLFDGDLAEPLRPLSMVGATGLVLLEDEAPDSVTLHSEPPRSESPGAEAPYFGIERPRQEEHGSGCMVGANAGEHVYEDPQGRRFSGHWVVPPGRQVNRTLVTELMDLPYDTTVHYVAVHLHPFAESLELRDLSTGEVVFTARAENAVGRTGLTRVDHFSSADGVDLHRGHQYELISVYDNPTGQPQDSMAVMFLYVLDREFVPPRPGEGS
jgi:hypothetical protein